MDSMPSLSSKKRTEGLVKLQESSITIYTLTICED